MKYNPSEFECEQTIFHFRDDVMFGKVLERKEIAEEFLRRMGPEETIELLSDPIRQKDFRTDVQSRGIRPDILIKTATRTFDIEMQQTKCPEVLQRMLFAEDNMRTTFTPPGTAYKDFMKTCIIFLSLFDDLGTKRPLHIFDGVTDQYNQRFTNGFIQMLYNVTRWRDEEREVRRSVLRFTATDEPTDSYTRDIQMIVDELNRDQEWKFDAIMRRRRETDLLHAGED
ncbi:MAG: hypothetical protein KBS81_02185, partial [Spirochaetales bacterium]|nr:hypothetical protein [Candidatus Physcosoma equi]